jgi:hypothetical protein
MVWPWGEFPHQIGVAAGYPADEEVVRLDALLGQHLQDAIGVGRQRTVVDGQHHFLVLEWQCLRILHLADAWVVAGIDRHHPAGAECAGIARTFIRARLGHGHRAKHQRYQNHGAPNHAAA